VKEVDVGGSGGRTGGGGFWRRGLASPQVRFRAAWRRKNKNGQPSPATDRSNVAGVSPSQRERRNPIAASNARPVAAPMHRRAAKAAPRSYKNVSSVPLSVAITSNKQAASMAQAKLRTRENSF